jgi:hypothetical protein
MPRQLLSACACSFAFLLIGLSGCGGDASSGGGGEGIGASGGLGDGASGGSPDFTLPPNHRAPLICSDGTLLVLPEGECVWGVCADEVSGLERRTGTCTPTGGGYIALGCENCVDYYENPSFYLVNEGAEEAYLLTNFPIDSVVEPLIFASDEVGEECNADIPPAGAPFPSVRAKFTLRQSECDDGCDSHSLFALQAGQAVSCETRDDLAYTYEIVWVVYDDDGTPLGLRGSMQGISPLTVGRNCTDAGCPQVDQEGVTDFRIEFDLAVSCESDPIDPCPAE